MDASRFACSDFREWQEREGESLCLYLLVLAGGHTIFCQHMFDRCQKEKAGLMVVMPEDVEKARWEQ